MMNIDESADNCDRIVSEYFQEKGLEIKHSHAYIQLQHYTKFNIKTNNSYIEKQLYIKLQFRLIVNTMDYICLCDFPIDQDVNMVVDTSVWTVYYDNLNEQIIGLKNLLTLFLKNDVRK